MRPDARRAQSQAARPPPLVHLKPAGSSRRVWELGRGDRDGYAWTCVDGGSKWRGRLSVTIGRKAVARRARSWSPRGDHGREGVKTFFPSDVSTQAQKTFDTRSPAYLRVARITPVPLAHFTPRSDAHTPAKHLHQSRNQQLPGHPQSCNQRHFP